MYCKNCGMSIEQNANFCSSCGSDLKETDSKNIEDSNSPASYKTSEPKNQNANTATSSSRISQNYLHCSPYCTCGKCYLERAIYGETSAEIINRKSIENDSYDDD